MRDVAGGTGPGAEWLGRELGGYVVLDVLGVGGMGVVLRGEHQLLGRFAAIKTARPDIVLDPGFERRFLLEARAVAALNHPAIVRLYDFAFEGDMPYMVMELVEGRTLDELLDGPIEPRVALEVLLPIAAALDYAHRHGVVHRDVKPSNILLADDGRTLVMDFGLACFAGFSLATDPSSVLGTPDYIAPEQLSAAKVDGRADVYSLATIVYEMVSGKKAFTGATWMEIASRRLTEPAPRLEGLPWKFIQALADGMDRNPAARPEGPLALLDSLAFGLGLAVALDDHQPALRPLAAVNTVN
ncbi:MAG TPA: serine/threonine-protein kinase [Candidatus Dormibacteraeota bacterium]|jgi:serine/threonine-protein kinase